MNYPIGGRPSMPLLALRRFTQTRRPREQCELCSLGLAPTHRHLLETATLRIVCVCDPCALRFQDVVGGRFKLIPRDARALPGLRLADAQWEGLALPINLAFFYHSAARGRVVAMYPSPAGATESLLPLAHWNAIVAANPMLKELAPDVEALLVNRVRAARECYVAPIDRCYELVGLIRKHWRGLSGGETAWKEIGDFFGRLRFETGGVREPLEVSHA